MTYPELKISLDMGDPETILSSIIDPYNKEDWKYSGMYFVVCDDGDVHCFDENGKEHKIEYIPYYCFFHQLFKKIIIPETVASIGSSAFFRCRDLISITIPNNVRSIGVSAFYGCHNLTSLTIGNRVTRIWSWAFNNCSNLTSVTIPDSVTHIGHGAFKGCIELMDVTIGTSVASIEANAFSNCHKLKSLVIKGKTIEQIQDMASYPWGIEDESIIQAEL